jgi:2,4-didehydro-3-deoxy-L-rhamnonate hydrolase
MPAFVPELLAICIQFQYTSGLRHDDEEDRMETSAAPWRLGSIRQNDVPEPVIELGDAVYGATEAAASAGIALPRANASVLEMLRDWRAWLPTLEDLAASLSAGKTTPIDDVTWLPPVLFPGKLVCVGANYQDHLAEMGIRVKQSRPFVFLKPAATSLVGHGGQISAPLQVEWLDWEAELALVIGSTLRDGHGPDVLNAVAGYTSLNDVSARDWAEELLPGLGQDWFMHKAFDHFTPIGPTITPSRFVADPQALGITLTVNGTCKQESNTAHMIFSIIEILEHVSSITTLEPGDIVATGSPAGVGYGRDPREALAPGDEVVVQIEGLSELRSTVGKRGVRQALLSR